MFKEIIAGLAILCSTTSWSFTCYITLAKDSCWIKKYNVTVNVLDAKTLKVLTTVTVPADTAWARQEFLCEPLQELKYTATFTPTAFILDKDKDKVYSEKNIWNLPAAVKPGETAWNISVCYPFSFAGVPSPPEATEKCECDFSKIPAPKPK